ncbi:MAG: hydroxymethylglutaryl-CoA reductase, degradative [Chloroflexota bacterium]|nr:hydroxymethylglutaryl-CoA reductase, degradative [Chloroflexota bacterium]
MIRSSRLAGFYELPLEERVEKIVNWAELTEDEAAVLCGAMGIDTPRADQMIENVVGLYGLPLGIAVNFVVNGRDILVPMVIEEPSVVAGASFAAKLARMAGGFQAVTTAPEMIGQLQVLDVANLGLARLNLLAARNELLALANEADPVIVNLGGGARDIEVHILEQTPAGPMLVVHLIFDCRDAMGANTVNTACESLAPRIGQITGGRVGLRILSNLANRRLAQAHCTVPVEALAFGDFSGEQVAQGIVEAWAFAAADPYRAVTHNKGIMNGVDAVVIATGNDWRAIEAGAHAYAACSGYPILHEIPQVPWLQHSQAYTSPSDRYTSLSTWARDGEGNLIGALEMPLAVGIVGGATRVHPMARVALKILGVQTAQELAEIIASVGLAQNLAALRALATEGIQRGHMRLHARQVAIAAGATEDEVAHVVEHMIAEGHVRPDRAETALAEMRAV